MCNYYETPEPNVFTDYFRLLEQVPLPLPKGVGPFNDGVFLRPAGATMEAGLQAVRGQWGMIRPGSPERWDFVVRAGVKTKQKRYTNNCRLDSIVPPAGGRPKPTFAAAWANAQRCLVPMASYQEPNWESSKNIWWNLRRADGAPWAIAGLWSEWIDRDSGEWVPNFTAITVNCDDHPLLNRLHKPDPKLPDDQQDKRSLVHLKREDWQTWLFGTPEEAAALLVPASEEMFDRSDAIKTDEILERLRAGALVPPPTAQQDELFVAEENQTCDETRNEKVVVAVPGVVDDDHHCSGLGDAGHRVVAELAEAQLRPPVRAEIKRLLANEEAASLASLASWADDHRSPATAAWHYVNIPREAACKYNHERDCAEGRCVVGAIERQAHVLAAATSDDDGRLKALKYLVHLVADIHQPLHAGYEDDRGGNKYQLRAFDRGSNLHALWDTGLIEAWPGGLAVLRRAVASDTSAAAGGDPAQWAEESCRLVATAGFYPHSRKVGEDYQHRAGPIVRSRLASAGRRLAQVLNASVTVRHP